MVIFGITIGWHIRVWHNARWHDNGSNMVKTHPASNYCNYDMVEGYTMQ